MLTTARSSSPSETIPSFMSFNFHPELGPNLNVWWIKPYRDWGLEEESVTIVAKNTAAGSVFGGSLGATWHLLGLDQFSSPLKTLKDCITTGALLGGIAGAIRGIYKTRCFILYRPVVVEATHQSAKKAAKIIEAFISTYETDDIMCPISNDIMIYPVKFQCSPQVAHFFDYFNIESWFLSKHKTCPICRREIQLQDMIFDREKERTIHAQVGVIFKKMEAILQRFPTRFAGCSSLPYLSDATQIANAAAKIKDGKALLEGDIDEIARKIRQPETLTDEEALTLAYFILHQMKPLKAKIDKIYQIAKGHLTELRTQHIIGEATQKHHEERLNAWYNNHGLIPRECVQLNALYNL